jgi:hypothetical protein
MSWGGQNRSKDAKTPSAGRGMSEKPELDLRPVQPYQISHTGQAPARQHVLFGRCLLADIALQALHPTIIDHLIGDTKYQLRVCAVFCHSEPKLATLKFLRRQKIFRLRR